MKLTDEEDIALNELHNFPEWKVYCGVAQAHIEDLTRKYLRADFDPANAWEARNQIRSLMEYQSYMEDLVRQASDRLNQKVAAAQLRELGENLDAGIEY